MDTQSPGSSLSSNSVFEEMFCTLTSEQHYTTTAASTSNQNHLLLLSLSPIISFADSIKFLKYQATKCYTKETVPSQSDRCLLQAALTCL